MTPPVMLNMVQLTMREGALALTQPMTHSRESVHDIVLGLKQFLSTENAEKFIFSSKTDTHEMKSELSEKAFRLMERSEYGIQSFFFSFETYALMYNNAPAEAARFPVFAKKLEQLMQDLKQDKLRVLFKVRS
jgi:hypothetical protein